VAGVSTIIAAAIAATGAIVAACLGAFFLVERCRIGWEINHWHNYSSGVGDDVRLMVKRSAVGELTKGAEEYRPTDQAAEAVIVVTNTGNRDIKDPVTLSFDFQAEAKVVLTAHPEGSPIADRIESWSQGATRNNAKARIRFLNKGQSLDLLIQTVDSDSTKIGLSVEQPGIAVWNMGDRSKAFTWAFRFLAAIVVLIAFALPIYTGDLFKSFADTQKWVLATFLVLGMVAQAIFLESRFLARIVNRMLG